MRTKLTSRLSLLFVSFALVLALPAIALADNISNSLDTSIDAVAETMPLTVGGADGTTHLYVTATNGDGKNGCNLTGSTTATFSVASSNTSVATVSPSSVTFGSCSDTKALTVSPVAAGSANISLTQTANSTGGSFNLAPATFAINVSPPPNTAPTVTVDGVTGGASYDKGSVPAATCNVKDAEDGPSSFPATLSAVTGTYASDGIGSQTASCSYTDDGPGTPLKAEASKTYSIVDPSAPVITKTVTGQQGDNGWYTGNVIVDWTVTENESPNSLQLIGCAAQNITADQAATEYKCSATSAGGSATEQSVTIKRDGTAPVIKDDGPASQPNAAGWYNTSVTNNFSASDALSGLANATTDASFTKTTTAEGRALTVSSGTVADAAGNVAASIDSRGFDVDKTAPTLNPSVSPNPVLLNGSATATSGAQDNLSGLASQGCDQVNTGSVGAKSVSCSATDNAGNTNSANASYNVNYRFAGFRAPVDNGGIFNSVKAGQSVPMKFSLSGNQGLSIIETGFPKVAAVTCPNSTSLVDQVEETTTANSGLTYDATADQYNYVWKTQSTYAGKCFRFDMKLIDGTTQSALFKFTK